MKFAQRLKTYRKARNMTQQELADRLGVSNKTVSRWEAEGGYPDVALLPALARALGVTVDDLLDGDRPLRTLTQADWQGLLSFAFALGGGILFFLLKLFVPLPVCYGVYLAAMLYGCYLQRYYAYRSRWFFWSNCGMELAVNLCVFLPLVRLGMQLWGARFYLPLLWRMDQDAMRSLMLGLAQGGFLSNWLAAALCGGILAAAVTAVSQRLIARWMRDEWRPGQLPDWKGKRLSIQRQRLTPWLLWPAFWAAVLVGFFLLYESAALPSWMYIRQDEWFQMLWLAAAVLASLPFWRRGWRWYLAPTAVLFLIAWNLPGLCVYEHVYHPISGAVYPVSPGNGSQVVQYGQFSWGMLVQTGVGTAVYALIALFRPRLVEKDEKSGT